MEATLADSSSSIEAVFPEEAVKLWQTKVRSLITSFPPGSLFHILESELRISDCFLPPRVELWIYSFEVVGGLGSDVPLLIKEIGLSPKLKHLLKLYARSYKATRVTNPDAVTMSSPLRSQESVCSSNASPNDADDIENREAKSISEPFYTQISQAPAPKYTRHPLTSKQPRTSQGYSPDQRVSMQDTPSLLTRNNAEVSKVLVDETTSTVEFASLQVIANVQSHATVREPAITLHGHRHASKMLQSFQVVRSGDVDLWPGGRTPLLNERYLPRYLTKISKDQQEILESPNAWQPSKTDRRIRGSIPNQILRDFTELADRTPKKAPSEGSLKAGMSPATKRPGNVDCDHGRNEMLLDAGSESSGLEESVCVSWPPTQESPALAEPALPDNSSPVRAAPRQLTRSLSHIGRPVASTDNAHQGEQSVGRGPSVPPPSGTTISELGKTLESVETASYVPTSPNSVRNLPISETSDADRENVCRVPSSKHCLSQGREQGQFPDAERYVACSSETNQVTASQQMNSVLAAPQTQKDVSPRKIDTKALVHVQRTPFVYPVSALIKGPESSSHPAVVTCSATGEPVLSDQGPRSSPSIVRGTCMNAQAVQPRKSELSTTTSLPSEQNSSQDERMKEGEKRKVIHVSKRAEVEDAASETRSSSTSHSVSGIHDRNAESRLRKRKRRSDHYVNPKVQPRQQVEGSRPRSGPAQSKKQRMTSTFPSLDAPRDLSATSSSAIARESRRNFLPNRRNGTNSSPLMSVPTSTHDTPHEGKPFASPLAMGRGMSSPTQLRDTTTGTGLLSRTVSKPLNIVDTVSGLPLRRESIYDTYKATYPEYQGDVLHFHKACKQIKTLYRAGKAPHPSLWDDFIFRRHHDYRQYLLEVTEACEDALPYLHYYSERVQKPSRMELIVRPTYILSVGSDSAIGSSVKSPPVAAHVYTTAADNLEGSVAASSSASNILLSQHLSSHAADSSHQRRQDLRSELHSQKLDDTLQAQDCSVEQWVEQQSLEKVLGAESPELGYIELTAERGNIPQEDLNNTTEIPASPFPCHPPAAFEKEERESVWCDDPDTPFKSFARSYTTLASERKHLRNPVKIDEKGCIQPQLQSVIDIFTMYKK